MNNNNFQDESTEYVTAGGSKGGISTFAIVLCSIALLMVIALVVFKVVQNNNNKEKEIVIQNSSNPNFNIGIWTEDEKNTSYTYVNEYSLWSGDFGKTRQDSLKHTIFKAFIVSKDSIVLCEFMERRYRDNVPHLKVFGNEINLIPYLRVGSCEYIHFYTPGSYNDLIFYTLGVIGKGSDKKYYSQPLTLMININTQECKVVGRGYYIDNSNGKNMALFDGKYFGILDFYMDSREYICKYYDTLGNYMGWTPNVGIEYTQTGKKVVYTTQLKNINTDWRFTYGNDKYGRPISMSKGLERYDVKYSNSGYHLTAYDDIGMKKYDFDPYDVNELFDLRTWDRKIKNNGKLKTYDTRLTSIEKNNAKYEAEYTAKGYRLKGYDDKGRIKFEYENNSNSNFDLRYWDLKIPNRGKLIKYSYNSKGVLDSREYYNESQSYYLRESQSDDGSFYCAGIFENSGEFIDDILIDVDILSGIFSNKLTIYRNDPKTGRKSKMAEVPEKQVKKYLLDYLYGLN